MPQLTIQQAFDLALQHHQVGRWLEAENLYRQILQQHPTHAGSLHYLGLLALQLGHHEAAVGFIRQAVANGPQIADANTILGNALAALGHRDEAMAAYRQAIAIDPNWAPAQSGLGNVLIDKGELDEAIAAHRRVIALNPNLPEAFNNLGNALRAKGQLDEAIAAYQQAIALNPNLATVHYNLGISLRAQGRLEEALAATRRALAMEPHRADAHNNLGLIFEARKQLDNALAMYRQAIALDPAYAESYNNLGNVLADKGQPLAAIAAYRQAIALRSDYGEAYSNLGTALSDVGQLDDAIAAYRRAIAQQPEFGEAWSNLGNALQEKGQLEDAVAAYRRCIALRPMFHEAHYNLGNVLKDQGRLDEALSAYRQAVAVNPDLPHGHSNLVFALYLHPEYDARKIAKELRIWNDRHARPLGKLIQPHTNDRDPERRLRIGYVSPDFREHVVGQNLLSPLRQRDRLLFEITCYSQVLRPDPTTAQFEQESDRWRNIVGLSDEQVANKIREDQIDILVDLAQHTARNRLMVFARKPAPVQITYLGYAGSTGMPAIDYRLSDPYIDPPGEDVSCYAEKTLRLARSYWCYQPRPAPEVSPAPAIANGFISFGCLNNFGKVSRPAAKLWVKILLAVPGSRLIIHAKAGGHREEFSAQLEQAGVDKSRLQFIGQQSWMEYANTYAQIDIALDPFPYGGGITSCDALWMGVPLVTLSGRTAVGRGGQSILSNLGLPELIAHSPVEYVRLAIELANDRDRIISLHQGMRQRMLASPLMDAGGFARDLESAYRQAWRTWCEASSPAT